MNKAPDDPKINDNRNYIYDNNFILEMNFPLLKIG
jgi:hypothetical protein